MTEPTDLPDADAIVASCRERMPSVKIRSAESEPDGFIVLDSGGNEIRRWFKSPRP